MQHSHFQFLTFRDSLLWMGVVQGEVSDEKLTGHQYMTLIEK